MEATRHWWMTPGWDGWRDDKTRGWCFCNWGSCQARAAFGFWWAVGMKQHVSTRAVTITALLPHHGSWQGLKVMLRKLFICNDYILLSLTLQCRGYTRSRRTGNEMFDFSLLENPLKCFRFTVRAVCGCSDGWGVWLGWFQGVSVLFLFFMSRSLGNSKSYWTVFMSNLTLQCFRTPQKR